MNINLKVTTEYSIGTAYAPLSKLISKLKEQNVTAAGMVDTTTWGHVKFFNACKKAGIQPLLGASAIVTDTDYTTPRMWFLAKNKSGLSELYQALSLSYQQKVPTRRGSLPRLHYADVLAMSENIFVFCGGVTNVPFLQQIAQKRPSSFFIDITDDENDYANVFKADLAESSQIKTVHVSRNEYIEKGDAKLLSYMRYGKTSIKDRSLQIPQTGEAEEAIAKACKGLALPVAPMIRMDGDLEEACRAAIPERFPNGWSEEYEQRLQHELREIKGKNFDSYFLLVQDMTLFAKQHMLVGPSRGSAAGSLVCYLLHITEIDPIPPHLFFERFIDKSRKDLPDIDLDFPDDKRELVIEYLQKKWGFTHVAHVGNLSLFKPASALAQVCKMLGIPSGELAQTRAAMIERKPSDPRAMKCLEDTLLTTEQGKFIVEKYPALMDAAALEGHVSHTGVHAAGVLVCNDEITKYCTVDDKGIAHIDKHDIEQLNLLKMDILGLRTLTVLADLPIKDWYHLPKEDAAAFDIFNKGKFCGVFQFEGKAMRKLASQVEFKSLDEIDAVTALARPAPMAAGIDKMWLQRHKFGNYKSLHPLLKKILYRTYELPLYQEDTMAIARQIGDFNWEQTSKVRKAISKSQGAAFLAPYKEIFVQNATKKGLSAELIEHIWSSIVGMGAWQMNKAHTYSYANVSYWVAYSKAHYPLEFAAATLNHAKDDESAIALLQELSKEGLKYVYFDLERSGVKWTVQDGILVGGFLTLNGIGEKKAEKLISIREERGFSEAEKDKLLSLPSVYKDLYPLTAKYKDYYDGHKLVSGDVIHLSSIPDNPDESIVVFIAKLIYKDARTIDKTQSRGNKENIGKRYYALTFKDDSGEIGGKITFHAASLVEFFDRIPLDTILLVRAKIIKGIRYAFIKKIRVLEFA